MKKASFVLGVVLGLLLTLTARSNQISFAFTAGDYPVYRFQDSIGGFIWTKLGVSTDIVVKEIVFDVYLSLDDGAPFTAAPIPAGVADDRVQWTKVTAVGNHWEFKYWTPDSLQYFIPIGSNQPLLDFYVKFLTQIKARGFLNIKLTNFRVKGVDAEGLTIEVAAPQLVEINVNLGKEPPLPPPGQDSLFLRATYLLSETEARINLEYTGKGFDQLEFNLNLPSGIFLKRIEVGLLSMDFKVDGSQIKIISNYLLPDALPNQWHHLAAIIVGYNKDISGSKRMILSEIVAKRDDTVLVVDPNLIINLDFGNGGDGAKVKYFLTSSHYYISLWGRPTTTGVLELFWNMDNSVETTAGLNCLVYLPSFMELAEITPIDLNGNEDRTKQIDFNLLSRGQVNKYALVYSTRGDNVLLPNPQSKNPRPIMRLRFNFSDLCPGETFVLIDDIVASGLDGRRLDETRQMSWNVDVNKFFNGGNFSQGDLNFNFGDEVVDRRDLEIMINILDGKITPSCYQRWAADLNGDGIIDSHDLTILLQKITTAVDDRPQSEINVDVCGNYLLYRLPLPQTWQLNICNYLGASIQAGEGWGQEGQVNLEGLNNGIYFYRFKTGDKIISGKFFIY